MRLKFNILYTCKALILIIAGCTTSPLPTTPAPILNSSFLEGQTTITGSGVPNGTVEIFLNGNFIARIETPTNGTFAVDVPTLKTGQVITATQTVKGQISPSSPPVIVQSAPLTQISISPSLPPTIEQGQIQRFTATGTFADGQKVNPLPGVRWNSTNSMVATIAPNGVTTTKESGKTTIQASRGGIRSPQISLTVKPSPPTFTGSLKSGDTVITGEAQPFASIQILINGTPRGNPVVTDSESRWRTSVSPPLKENDHVTSTQTVNGIESDSSPRLTTGQNNAPTLARIGNQRLLLGRDLDSFAQCQGSG